MTVIDRNGLSRWNSIREYRHYGFLFALLVLRDIRLRFRHTALGLTWAILQPLLPMLLLAMVFGRMKFETGGVPYPLFVFSGMAIWMFIANSVNAASPTFVNNYSMLNKIYFPRAILPAAVVMALMVDSVVATIAVMAVAVWYGYGPLATWGLLPLVSFGALLLATSVGIAAASLTAILRDIKNVVPFVVQVWMFASPVFYPLSELPAPLRPFAAMNPVVCILATYRYCLLGLEPDWTLVLQSGGAALTVGVIAILLFHRLEADLAEQV